MKKIMIITTSVIACILIALYVLLFTGSIPEKSNFNVSLHELKQLALKSGAKRPVKLNAMIVLETDFFKGGVVAGQMKNYRFVNPVYQILYKSKSTTGSIVIDTAIEGKTIKEFGAAKVKFYKRKYDRLLAAMKQAKSILLTHEHYDHNGGLVSFIKNNGNLNKVYITEEQKKNSFFYDIKISKTNAEKMSILKYKKYHVFAPGVILIKNPGHTKGHQMVYVLLQNGTEYLLSGDTTWHRDNLELKKTRPLLISLFLKEDRSAVAHQMAWLRNNFILKNNPVHLIISHDKGLHRSFFQKGLLSMDFYIEK